MLPPKRENLPTTIPAIWADTMTSTTSPERYCTMSLNPGSVEIARARQSGFCCGGGGGRFWMEERIGKRISEMRIEQVMDTSADVVASACPYCLQMFEDAIKAKEAEETLKAQDIAEIVAASL